jgi:hypothetical protein
VPAAFPPRRPKERGDWFREAVSRQIDESLGVVNFINFEAAGPPRQPRGPRPPAPADHSSIVKERVGTLVVSPTKRILEHNMNEMSSPGDAA